jgi:2-polyprenyl-3-methyl-5-hydroxy-6-metoxy-1,4-benzoquinol methylase
LDSTNNTGQKTLEVIAKADKFNKWMYDTIRPYCNGNILEIGSGIGNISSFFVRDNFSITLSDADRSYVELLEKKFGDNTSVKNILFIDLQHPQFSREYSNLSGHFDTVFFLNVLEHIENDEMAIQNCRHLLKPGGTLIILVPAYSFLYSDMDRSLHHFRRYTIKSLSKLVSANQFTLKRSFYFNALGIAGWVYIKLFRRKKIASGEMGFFNKINSAARILDKIVLKKLGLSVIVVAQKQN